MNAYLLETAVSTRLDGVSDFRVSGRSPDRLLGAYYTDTNATDAMARWALRKHGDRILEPSFGDGAFLHALRRCWEERRLDRVELFGAELVYQPFASALNSQLIPKKNAFLGDFLGVEPFKVDAVVGNPPYVRLRHLPPDQTIRALHVAKHALGHGMETSGSLWMPFVLHSMRFLELGGRMALVLPHEITYVRYARPLWQKLARSFSDLRLVRVHERLFPDILQEVVVLFADGFGGTTSTVRYQSIERATQFTHEDAQLSTKLPISDIVAGKRAFLEALLPEATRSLVTRVLDHSTRPLPEACVFNIGYVAGDKDFFHPTDEIVRRYRLPAKNLRPAITSGKQIRSCGLRTSSARCLPEQLYVPPTSSKELRTSDRQYIAAGEQRGVHRRYKCAVRDPWYVVPGVRVPDLLLSVFAERPVLVINDAGHVASNSLLCGYLRESSAESVAAAWYTSLTLLQIELQVHALGGGLLVLVPGEIGKIRLPECRPSSSHLKRLNGLLSAGDVQSAYRIGDETILQSQLGLTADEVRDIRVGINVLRYWRTSANGGVERSLAEESE